MSRLAPPALACIIATLALLAGPIGCRPPTGEELTAETDALFKEGSHKSALKKLVIYMRRNPGEVALKERRLDYMVRAGGIGTVLGDATNEAVPESVKPSRDGYRGFLISWVGKGLKSEDAKIRSAVINALGDIGRGGSTAELKKMLAAGGDERATAINALVALKSGDAYQLLINEIASPDVEPSMFEVAIPRRSPVPRILNAAIDSKDPGVRAGALLALPHAGIQGKYVVSVRTKLKDPDGAVRGAAARALGAHRDTESKAAIEKMLAGDKDAGARAGAAAGLGTLFDHGSIGALWTAFANKSQPAEVRGEAAFSLSGFRCSAADTENPCLSGAQVGAVKRARNEAALAPVKELCLLAAAELLDGSVRSKLKDLLMSDSKRVRTAAAKLLWQFDDKTVDKFLTERLKAASDEAAARKALVGFEAWQSQELAPLVVEFANTEQVPKSLRLAAVRTMTRIGWKGREAAVQMFTSNSTPEWLRLAAGEAARTALDPKNGDDAPLIAALDKAGQNMVHTATPALKEAALRLLLLFGDKANLASLQKNVLAGPGKPGEIRDAPGGKEVPPEHTPLLTYQVAAIAKWL